MTSASITTPSGRTFTYVVERGVWTGSGVLLAAGAGGDFPMLTLDERKAVSETIVRAADGRTPVVVGAQDTNPARSVELARFAEDIGAWGIQLAPGYYYASSPDDCYRVFRSSARSHQHAGNHDLQHVLGGLRHVARRGRTACRAAALCRPQVVHRARRPGLPAPGSSASGSVSPSSTTTVSRAMTHMLGGRGIHHPPVHRLARARPRGLSSAGSGRLPSRAQQRLSAVNWPWYDFRVRMWRRTGAESPVINAALEVDGQERRPEPAPHAPPRRVRARRAENASLIDIGVPGVPPDP